MIETRATCLSCMDGRIQLPVIFWIKENYKVDHVDMITEPGMDGLLIDSNYCNKEINRKVKISIERNNAVMIFIVAHHDCRGNPVSEKVHKEEIVIAVDCVKKEFPLMPIIGLWVNDQWNVEVMTRID